MKSVLKLCMVIVAAGLLCPTGADAYMVSVGDPIPGGSWAQGMNYNLSGPADFIRMDFIGVGPGWEMPPGGIVASDNWLVAYQTATIQILTRVPASANTFGYTWSFFDGTLLENVYVHCAVYNAGSRLAAESGTYHLPGNGWVADNWNPGTDIPAGDIPEPSVLMLSAAALLLYGLSRRRKAA